MPSAWVSFATIARVNEADSAEIASSSRGTKAASLTSSWSGSGRPDMYARRKTRNVSFAASVTRFRTARSEPVRPTMFVSSFTSLHGLHDRLVSLDIPGRDRPLPLRRAVGLSDDQEPSFADQKRTYADRDGKGRDVRQHAS